MLTVVSLSAQNPTYKSGLTIKKLWMDYQSQNGGNITEFRSYHSGFEIGYVKSLTENISLYVPFKMGDVTSHQEVENLHKRVYGIDGQFQYFFLKENSKVIPHILGGLGAVSESDGEFNIQAPLGFGVNFQIDPKAFITYQSEYRLAFSEDRNNLHHGIGFTYLFGGESAKEPMPMTETKGGDSDGDGLIDEIDLCPQIAGPKSLNGCPDSDGDGIADYQDKCPDLAGVAIFKGCPDSDGDGISDNDDECPNMAGIASNNGCPDNDRDKDGVPNQLDKCPDIAGTIAMDGCPDADRDNDGVADGIDLCPDQKGTAATNGCPDSDGDGITDNIDKCPRSAGLKVFNGCPDSDGDGIDDGRDKCPYTYGPVSTGGCPEISEEDRRVLDTAMRSVQFDTGRATLKFSSTAILRQIGDIMARYPDYNLAINGHTDNTGSATANQQLSERRAKACYEYLISIGVPASRMNFTGYGESRPVSENTTLKGRALNRRTEFNLIPR